MNAGDDKNEHFDKNTIDDSQNDQQKIRQTKLKLLKRIIVLAIIFTAISLTIHYYLTAIVSKEYLTILQSLEVALIGYFVIEVVSNAFRDLTIDYLKDTSNSIRILMRILGAVIIIAIIITYLSHDPIIAASIGTISALVVGFASQNILGNIIAGLYLAIIRPFKIGEEITAFNNTGIIFDIGLISTKLMTNDNKTVLIPNTSMLTTTIILNKKP
ncbi:MAG TPA: mechanosensitive ion channel domain-containing protein [Nitrososphaeraceae archaeon]|nr:mechanosensitive ion channel domain-containing protein [Nitrososphaeraceae archaeon]